MNKGNLSFGFSAIAAGQKSSVINADPQLVAASTSGKFSITPAVSAKMGLQPGDYIQFADNLTEIDAAIRNRQPELVAIAEENGIDLNTPEGVDAMIKEFRVFGIFKGVALLNADGTPKMCNARTSKEAKLAFIEENREAMLQACAENGVENPTEEQLLSMVESDKEPAYSGSKLATTSNMTGIGLGLNFTDSNVWNVLKADLDPETRTSTKRVYDVDVKNTQKIPYFNGKENVEVELFLLTKKGDEAVIERQKKA